MSLHQPGYPLTRLHAQTHHDQLRPQDPPQLGPHRLGTVISGDPYPQHYHQNICLIIVIIISYIR